MAKNKLQKRAEELGLDLCSRRDDHYSNENLTPNKFVEKLKAIATKVLASSEDTKVSFELYLETAQPLTDEQLTKAIARSNEQEAKYEKELTNDRRKMYEELKKEFG